MHAKPRTPEETYGPALERARRALLQLEPHEAAVRAGVVYKDGAFQIPFLGTTHAVSWSQSKIEEVGRQQEAEITVCILLLHYLLSADGTPQGEKWIAFRNLPGGLGYDAAFQRRANLRLAGAFGRNQAAFEAAACALGGERLGFGDASFCFRVLPRLWLAAVLYVADEEFPASANVLFDSSADHYLPTEDLAVLGGLLASRLIKSAPLR